MFKPTAKISDFIEASKNNIEEYHRCKDNTINMDINDINNIGKLNYLKLGGFDSFPNEKISQKEIRKVGGCRNYFTIINKKVSILTFLRKNIILMNFPQIRVFIFLYYIFLN